MPSYSLDGRLGMVIARGAKLSADLAEGVTAGSLSLTLGEVSQLSLTVLDSGDFKLLESGLFSAGTPRRRGSQLDYGGLNFEVRSVEVASQGERVALNITARSIGAGNLKRARGPLVRKKISPTQFAALEAKAAGLKFIGQRSTKRAVITRKAGDEPESSWDTIQRLASELGFVCFEAAGVLYFGKPTWLLEREDRLEYRIAWKGAKTDDGLDDLPRCRRSGDDPKNVATVSATLRGTAGDEVLPGMALVLDGVPSFEGAYLIESVTLGLGEGQAAQVEATTAVNPAKQPPPKKAKKGSSSTATATTSPSSSPSSPSSPSSTPSAPATGARSAASFVALAQAQAGDTYIYGVEVSLSDPNPNAFDCSELIEWAAARVGVNFPGNSVSMIAACQPISVEQAIATRGALLYTSSPYNHIAISLGNGMTIEAANSRVGVVNYSAAGRFQRGGLIPGLRY